MTHPEELLAEYVDGTLPEGERAVVSAHLETCARCRAEVAAATSARTALRAVPAPAMPEGVAAAALEAAARDAAERAPNTTSIEAARAARWQRWMVGAGAAAAIVLLVAVALPGLGGGGEDRLAQPVAPDAGQEGSAPGPLSYSRVETIAGEISDEDVQRAASDLLLTAEFTEAPEATPVAGGSAEDVPFAPTTAKAEKCLIRAFSDLDGSTPIRLWRASFQGRDSYVGFYAESPGAGLPADRVAFRVASTDRCVAIGSGYA